ncbi:MAG: UvrD-helicase domain-containing protein [Patescibacteria group bacterium]|nr:UvrD-helicase domain-containing protein [Patescibacteria group bacterium]
MLDNILQNLNPEQEQAVKHKQGPLLIVAGAGTGKTTVITRRIAWLIDQKLAEPNQILALTFTDKAAGEMEERVDKLLPYGYVDLWVSTFHAFGERILHQYAIDIGLPDNFKLLNQTDQSLLIRQNLDKFDLDYYKPLGNPTKFIQALIKHFSRCKDELLSPADYLKFSEEQILNQDTSMSSQGLKQEVSRLQEVANAYHTYQQILLDNNSLDFGDLINYTLKLFKERPLILQKYQQQFKYILVDEFQDTNYAQYELVKLLAQPNNNLTVCADDDQSIYKFRGASVSNVLQFKKDYPLAQNVVLIKNYRSGQPILDLSYNFIQLNNPNRLEIQLQTTAGMQISKKLISQQDYQTQIKHFHLATQEDEAEKVVSQILEFKKTDPDLKWSDCAILVRANNQADLFIQMLEWAEVPHEFLASTGLYKKPIILDILAYLRLLDDYHESSALFRVLNSPVFKINIDDLHTLTYFSRRKNWSLYEALNQAPSLSNLKQTSLKTITKLLGLIQKHTQLAVNQSVGKIIFSFLEDSGYLKILTQQETKINFDSLNWLNQFLKKVEEFERVNLDKSINNFREFIDLALEAGDMGSLHNSLEQSSPDSVKIMTIHGSKGLEFKYVFIVNLVDKRFPSIERSEAIELPTDLVKEIIPSGDVHLQEERRLFYVAMTRAKQGLFLTSAEDYGGTRKKKISRFLTELDFNPVLTSEDEKVLNLKQRYKNLSIKTGSLNEVKTRIEVLPDKFSFTQLKAFETCPLQYKFAHILKIPVRGRFTFSFGKTMHATLYKFFQQILDQKLKQPSIFEKNQSVENKIPSLGDLMRLYQENWIDDWYLDKKQKEKYFQQGEQILKDFYQKIKQEKPQVKFLEIGFNFTLDKYSLRGQIDRVDDLGDGQIEIIDYKTGSPKDAKGLNSEDKEQLLIYQMAGQQIFKNEIKKLTFYYLNNNQAVSFLGSQAELDKLRNKILKIIQDIKVSHFPATPSKFTCQYCDFRDICEHSQG